MECTLKIARIRGAVRYTELSPSWALDHLPVDRHDLALITARDAVRRSDPLTITKDSALEPASVATATSSAAQGAARDQMKRDRGADDTGSKHDNVTARQENLCCDMDAMMPLRSRWQGS
jgi:hypothetical protein